MKQNNPKKLMLDLDGFSLTDQEVNLLSNPFVAGIILFSRNFKSKSQVQSLCEEIQSINPALAIAVDHEGGRVQRFKRGYTIIPSMHQLTNYCMKNNFKNISFAQDVGWVMAAEVIASGVDFSFAPVLDLDLSRSSIIGDRSFGDAPDTVIRIANAFIDGMNEAGMKAIGKHFPGHGGIHADSHHEFAEDTRTFDELETHDLLPFDHLKNKLGGIMTAHISFAEIDTNIATFSKFWLSKILRNKMNYQGIIFSDDLSMKGAHYKGSIPQKIEHAFDAGCNILLICNDRPTALEALNFMKENNYESAGNLITFKASKSKSWDTLEKDPRRLEVRERLKIFPSN